VHRPVASVKFASNDGSKFEAIILLVHAFNRFRFGKSKCWFLKSTELSVQTTAIFVNTPSCATGAIWQRSPHSRGQIVRYVCEILERTYGQPRHGNPADPIDDLVYVLLSNRTPPDRAKRIFHLLKKRLPSWQDVLSRDPEEVAEVLRPAGFANRRTRQLRETFEKILNDFGELRSGDLWEKSNEDLLDYLTDLRGVSDKVARCVMMYSLGRAVLPVDVHVHRVAVRLGWTRRKRPGKCHEELEALLPGHRYYSFHVGCVAHGRARCTASSPACEGCPIRRYCTRVNGTMAPSASSPRP